jgi:hypothetical protein
MLVNENSGKMINFGRSLKSSHPCLFQWIEQQTATLEPPAVSFNERVYMILNSMQERPCCRVTGEQLKFKNFFYGFRKGLSPDAIRRQPKKSQTSMPNFLNMPRWQDNSADEVNNLLEYIKEKTECI